MRDYLKCVLANKATLTGYVGIATGVVSFAIGMADDAPGLTAAQTGGLWIGYVGMMLNALTSFGLETLSSYQRTREHIRKVGRLDERFYDLYRRVYCTSKGAQLAAREAGLERLIER